MPEELIAGGAGKDGKITVLDAANLAILEVRRAQQGSIGNLKTVDLRLGGPNVLGTISLHNRANERRARLTGDGTLHLGGGGATGRLSMNDRNNQNSVEISADDDLVSIDLGAANVPARIQLTTGGNPGPVIRLDGSQNALQFTRAGAPSDAIVDIKGTGRASFGGFGNKGRITVRQADGTEAVRIDGGTGDVVLANADCAEEFDLAGDAVEPGTVLVITDDGSVAASDKPYDTRVAGVVSGAGSFRPAVVMDRRDTGNPRVPVALVGKVYCFADATTDPIRVGDLLTTGDRRGHAQRIVEGERAFGAVLGKSLAALPSGTGLIPVLVALQ
ncbi:MAG: hypothetical protein ABW219_07720 [Ilumatobacteraceae bacterium]